MLKIKKTAIVKKLPSYLLHIFTMLLIVISFIIVGNNLVEYKSINQKEKSLQNIYFNKQNQIDKMNIYLESEVDKEYKEEMARLLGYCYPEEIIYYTK